MPRLSLIAVSMTMILASGSIAAQSSADPKPKYRSAKEIMDASPASAWRTLDPANTLYMDLPNGRVIELCRVLRTHLPRRLLIGLHQAPEN